MAPIALMDKQRHPHPLVLRTSHLKYCCSRCKGDGFGRRYQCEDGCCMESLHESCAICPETLDNFFLHRGHAPLTLQQHSGSGTLSSCDACGEKAHGYFYRCQPCNFDLHPFCSILNATVSDPAHPAHPLSFKPAEAEELSHCTVCRKQLNEYGGSYRCAHCDFQVHVRCLSIYPKVPLNAGQPSRSAMHEPTPSRPNPSNVENDGHVGSRGIPPAGNRSMPAGGVVTVAEEEQGTLVNWASKAGTVAASLTVVVSFLIKVTECYDKVRRVRERNSSANPVSADAQSSPARTGQTMVTQPSKGHVRGGTWEDNSHRSGTISFGDGTVRYRERARRVTRFEKYASPLT